MTQIARRGFLLTVAATAGGCAGGLRMPGSAPAAPVRREHAQAVTASNRLISFNVASPGRLLSHKPLRGLAADESVLAMDFRQKNDTLYALGSSGRLYTIDHETGQARPVGPPLALALPGGEIGMDFNPTVDRIRVISDGGLNLRLHPDTGAIVDSDAARPGLQIDGALAYVEGDPHAGRPPRLLAAAYSYNKADPKITTQYAIDAATASLVRQGSLEGTTPVVSPNTGRLSTIGPLGVRGFTRAAFDIHVLTDLAFAALTFQDSPDSRFYEIDVKSGLARPLGTIGGAEPVVAMALESW